MADEKIKSFLKTIAKRKNIQKWLVYVSWCMLVAVSIAFILNVIAIFVPIYNASLYGLTIIVTGLLVSFIYLIIKRTNMYEAARYADSAGLKERLVTSIEFIGVEDGFAGLLKEDTVDEISRFDKKLRLPLNYPWKRYIVSGILACMFVICIFVPSQAKKDATRIHKLAMQAKEVKDKAEEAMELLDKVEDENEGLKKEEAQKLKKILEEAKKELAESINESDIKKAEERLKSKLKQELAQTDNQKLIEALQPLVPDSDLAKMADFNKKLANIAQKGGIDENLINELKNVAESLTPEQMEKLLEELKKAMEDGEITASEVASSLSGIGNRDAQMAAATITASSGNGSSQGGAPASSAVPSASGSNSNGSPNPSASSASSGGSGAGSGNGSGQNGSGGSGQGIGNGGGAGSGAGWNMGNSEGLERKEQEGKGEVVYLTGKEQGSDDNLTGKKSGEAKITEKSDQMGGALSGSKAELDTVIGDYSSEAYAKVNSNKVPSAMKDIVKEYFSGFSE